MKKIMSRIINFFEPTYHSVCKSMFGCDITQVLVKKWEMPYEKVHEHIMAWSLMGNFVLIIVTVVLTIAVLRH